MYGLTWPRKFSPKQENQVKFTQMMCSCGHLDGMAIPQEKVMHDKSIEKKDFKAHWVKCHCSCCAKTLQSCLTLFDLMDCNPSGCSIHGILQARILEWVANSSSKGYSWPRDWTCVSYTSCIGRQVVFFFFFFFFFTTNATWEVQLNV